MSESEDAKEYHVEHHGPVQGSVIGDHATVHQHFYATQDKATSPSKPQRVWNVPYLRNPHFTGRDELLERLHQQLTPMGPNAPAQIDRVALTQPQAIKGLGGIGKTQIAVEYAYRSRDLGQYTHTFWVNAASEEALLTSFVELAELLPAFPAKGEMDQSKLVAAIKRWLEQCQEHWLLIFDNADEVALVRDYLPKLGNGSVLLTTRAHAVGSLATSIEVETMGFLEGTQLLLRRAQRLEQASDEEINQAGNIVITLDHFPLALDQAGAYIEETQCDFAVYLDLYRTHRQALLACGTLATDYPHSVATTWSLSFQKIEQANPAAAELLHLCSFLAPDQIPEELLRDGVAHWPPLLQKAAADPFAFQQMIAELLKFSLVKRLVENHTLSIHRLVQAVQRDAMGQEVQRLWAERVTRAVDQVFPHNSQDPATWPQCLRYLDQVHACHRLIEHYMLHFVEAADLLNRAGLYLNDHALYAIAKLLYQSALMIREQVLGADHPDTATILNNLAILYDAQGQDREAERLYQRALVIQGQSLGAIHPEIARTLDNLASIYENQGKYIQAEPLIERALAIREQTLGPMHADTAHSLHSLATLRWRQGKFVEAEPLYQHALAIREHILGPTHPNVALSVNNLAVLYWNTEKYERAELFYQRALLIWEQMYGPTHPYIAGNFHNRATLSRVQGKYQEAESLYQRALSIWEQMYGPTHPNVAFSLNSLAELYRLQERYQEAESLYQRALSIWEQMYGPNYLDAALSLHGLAKLYSAQNNSSQAERLYRQALSIRMQALEPAHPDVLNVLEDYMALLRRMSRSEEATEWKSYAEAELLYQRALQIREQQLGPEHSDVAIPLNGLANLYRDQGKYTKAEPLYQRALQIREQQLGPEHSDVAETINDLAQFWEMQGNRKKAKSLYTHALAVHEQALGVQHPKTVQTRQNYAALLRAIGRDDEAKQFEEKQ